MKIYTQKSIRRQSYKIYTLGCKVNQYDSGKLAAELERAGFYAVDKKAALAVINSCAVTKTAMIKSGRMVKLAKKQNPRAKIVLAGCWAKISKIKISGVDFVIGGNKIIKQINKIANYELRITNKIALPLVNSGLAMTERTRYFIKIQDGCEQFCSYCIIPYARGKMESRGAAEIIAEIKQALKVGYQELVLCGIHLGLYGKDLTPQPPLLIRRGRGEVNLVNLLKKLIKIDGLGRIRLSSIEITEVNNELIKLMASSKKLCRHLHIPLQSGSSKILKFMNRPYTAKYFKNKIKKIRKAMPDIAITTDIIVGFPGETKKEFKETLNLIKKIKFSRLHVFPFSAHEKTPAFTMLNQVRQDQIERRAKILRKLNNKLVANYRKKFKGKNLEILVERVKQNKIIGKTEFYFDVEFSKKDFKNKKLKLGEIVKVKI